jgi:type I restriction enzyme R subunit
MHQLACRDEVNQFAKGVIFRFPSRLESANRGLVSETERAAECVGYLRSTGHYSPEQISRAIYLLRTEADKHNRSLYDTNRAVYGLLRYGVPVKTDPGKPTETVHLVDWKTPENNDFAIAEEVTLKGGYERRPDLVLYLNGIAVGVIELKSSRVSIGDGIRQNLSNQLPEFNQWFFGTIQFIFAGSDSEGLQYGTIGTSEKFFLKWQEDEQDNSRFKLDKYLLKICRKDRLIELLHDFVLFDGGIKKLPRVHQYFGVKAAQQHVRERRGGIIWHTQGSGKSIVMVLLAKWILENKAAIHQLQSSGWVRKNERPVSPAMFRRR